MQEQLVFAFGTRKCDFSTRTHLMGILNVTPDSFSDGGRYLAREAAVEHALQMIEDGADFIDVGGESTRPKSNAYGEGADAVSIDEELRRVLPVIESLRKHSDTPVSIDTYKSEVAKQALQAGASLVNDISGFTFDPSMPGVIADAGATAVVMHIRGTPKTMQMNPSYTNLIGEVSSFLENCIKQGKAAGIKQLIVDPGIGFGKLLEHNLELIGRVGAFAGLGCPLLVGASRKSFIGTLLNTPVDERIEGSLAAAVACILNGAHILRVHDVKETRRAALVADAIKRTEAQPV